MKKSTAKLLNIQIQKELESSYLYLGFANYFEEKNLYGFAQWYRIQSKEEIDHALKIFDFLHEINEPINLLPLESQYFADKDIGFILNKGLESEKKVTASINAIYKNAMDESDYNTMDFLSWFIQEQREEESSAQALVDKYSLFGQTPEGLYLLNKEFGKRT